MVVRGCNHRKSGIEELTKPSGVTSVLARPPGVSLLSTIIHEGPSWFKSVEVVQNYKEATLTIWFSLFAAPRPVGPEPMTRTSTSLYRYVSVRLVIVLVLWAFYISLPLALLKFLWWEAILDRLYVWDERCNVRRCTMAARVSEERWRWEEEDGGKVRWWCWALVNKNDRPLALPSS